MSVLNFFPNLNDLDIDDLRKLYRLKDSSEWKDILFLIELSKRVIVEFLGAGIVSDHLSVDRHIGALVFTNELPKFMEAVEETLNELFNKGGPQK